MDYANILSRRAQELKPSGIRRFFDLASTMEGVISLGVGEPDFKTPYSIRRAGIESLEKGRTWYTANAGLLELRRQIAAYLARRFDLPYEEGEVLVTVGGSEAIDLCVRACLDPGDEVLIPEPCFVCYDPITRLAGGVPVPIVTRPEDGFRLTPEALEAAITPRTKLLVLPYPNNPTGAIMKKEHLEAIIPVVLRHNILVLSDEIYAELTFEGRHVSIASLPGMAERTVVVNGFSKAYAMTGWRLGYAAGPKAVIQVMTKLHQFAIMCAPTTSQYAAVEALKNGDEDVAEMCTAYNQRRRFLLHAFREMGLECFEPYGAFYMFPCIKEFGMTSEEFAMRFLKEEKVAVVPGNAFGDCGEGYLRISYASSLENLKTAMGRLEKFIGRLRAERRTAE